MPISFPWGLKGCHKSCREFVASWEVALSQKCRKPIAKINPLLRADKIVGAFHARSLWGPGPLVPGHLEALTARLVHPYSV